MMENIKKGIEPTEAIEKASGVYGRFEEAVKKIVTSYLGELDIVKLSKAQINSVSEKIRSEIESELSDKYGSGLTQSEVEEMIAAIEFPESENTGQSEAADEDEIKNLVKTMIASYMTSDEEVEKISREAAQIARQDVSAALTEVKNDIAGLKSSASALATRITGLQNAVSSLGNTGVSSSVTYITESEVSKEEILSVIGQINEIKDEIEYMSRALYLTSSASGDAVSVNEYVTILAENQYDFEKALGEMRSLLSALEDNDTWAGDIVLDKEAAISAGGYAFTWTLTSEDTGLNLTAESDITITYAEGTQTVISYEQGDGYLIIKVPEKYADTFDESLVIKKIHCENPY